MFASLSSVTAVISLTFKCYIKRKKKTNQATTSRLTIGHKVDKHKNILQDKSNVNNLKNIELALLE